MIDDLRRSGDHSGAAFWTKVAVCLTDLHEIRYVGSIASPAADGRRISARAVAHGQSGPTRQHPDAAASRPNPAPETRTDNCSLSSRSTEAQTYEVQSLMRNTSAVFSL